ncbi:hypothetical protein MUG91_G104n21 [Manis pentadactyla]|nr:hypothetical protein MUG91_G104n21 [Manis pentadactyla]
MEETSAQTSLGSRGRRVNYCLVILPSLHPEVKMKGAQCMRQEPNASENVNDSRQVFYWTLGSKNEKKVIIVQGNFTIYVALDE